MAVSTLNFDIEVKSHSGSPDYVVLLKMLENEKKKLVKVKLAYEEGIDTLEEYKLNKTRITASITKIEKDLAKQTKAPSKESFAKKIGGVIEVIENPTVSEAEKNTALRTIISKIEFCKPGNTVRLFFYA